MVAGSTPRSMTSLALTLSHFVWVPEEQAWVFMPVSQVLTELSPSIDGALLKEMFQILMNHLFNVYYCSRVPPVLTGETRNCD